MVKGTAGQGVKDTTTTGAGVGRKYTQTPPGSGTRTGTKRTTGTQCGEVEGRHLNPLDLTKAPV